MTAWASVLLFNSRPLTISGIETEAKCRELARQIRQDFTVTAAVGSTTDTRVSDSYKCYSYRAARNL